MKAIVIRENGGLDVLQCGEFAEPSPGPGELKVRVAAAGCNFADTLMAKGTYQDRPELPFVPGLELAGEVVEVGEGVTIAMVPSRNMRFVMKLIRRWSPMPWKIFRPLPFQLSMAPAMSP